MDDQNLEKNQRNKIIKELCDQGAGFSQQARITGISYRIIQRVVTDQSPLIYRQPDGIGSSETMSAGDIMHELNYRGFRGRDYNANNIGKTMKKLGFESRVIHGTRKYLVVKVDFALHTTENKEDAKEFTPDIF